MILPVNLPSFAPGVALIGREVVAHLYEVTSEELSTAASAVEAASQPHTHE